jgi:myo-inositol-1(or 4)-monophosphatase
MVSIIAKAADALTLARRTLLGAGDRARVEVHDSHIVDISTAGDRAVSRALIDFFKNSGLPATLQSEESGRLDLVQRPEYLIAFDDLDGTDNFFRGNGLLPYCTVISILGGSAPRFDDTLASGVVEHRTGMTWLAEKGKGVVVNGTPSRVSRCERIDRRTVIAVDHYGSREGNKRFGRLHTDAWVKDFGSSGFHLAGVASGMFQAFVNAGQKGHELAAGYLLVTEGGGTLVDFQGMPYGDREYDFDSTYEVIASCTPSLAASIANVLTPP